MLRAKLEAMRNKNLGDKTDVLWGENDEEEKDEEERMPGDVVSKEVGFSSSRAIRSLTITHTHFFFNLVTCENS